MRSPLDNRYVRCAILVTAVLPVVVMAVAFGMS